MILSCNRLYYYNSIILLVAQSAGVSIHDKRPRNRRTVVEGRGQDRGESFLDFAKRAGNVLFDRDYTFIRNIMHKLCNIKRITYYYPRLCIGFHFL